MTSLRNRPLLSISLIVLALSVGIGAPINAADEEGAEEAEILLTPAENPGQPYEVVQARPLIVFQEFPRMNFKDPLLVTIERALKVAEKEARKAGADALIAMRIEFESPAEGRSGEEGRLLLYGTLVRFN